MRYLIQKGNCIHMEYKDKISQCTSLEELFELWREKSDETVDHKNNTFIADGIVNTEVWNNTDKKILYVLKEAYGNGWDDTTLAKWIDSGECLKYKIWRRIPRWTYGIFNTDAKTQARFRKELDYTESLSYLKKIAILNIKKSDGKPRSKYEEITKYGKHDKDEIIKEIELIDPDIIICGNVFSLLYNSVFEFDTDFEEIRNDNWYYYLNVLGRERLFIDYYHPANHWSELMNYYGVVSIYQQALVETSGKA